MIRVRIPLALSMEWDWLEERLERAVDRASLEYDGGEEEDGFEVFDFPNATASQVETVVRGVLGARRSSRLDITWVTPELLQLSGGRSNWLLPLNIYTPDRYERAVKRYCQQLSADIGWGAWWAASAPGHALWFHRLAREDGSRKNRWVFDDDRNGIVLVYAPIIDPWMMENLELSIADARDAARAGVREVLERTCEHFAIPGLPSQ